MELNISGSVSKVKGMLRRSVEELRVDELILLERNSDEAWLEAWLEARERSGWCWYGPIGIGP